MPCDVSIETFSWCNEILNADLSFIDQIGLKEHLSPNRANGLSSMLKQIKFYALAYSKLN